MFIFVFSPYALLQGSADLMCLLGSLSLVWSLCIPSSHKERCVMLQAWLCREKSGVAVFLPCSLNFPVDVTAR